MNYLIYDADPTVGYAFANWRTNPNTGEIRGASVYFNGALRATRPLDAFDARASRPEPARRQRRPPAPAAAALRLAACPVPSRCATWHASAWRAARLRRSASACPPTRKEKVELYLTHIVAHEIGHTLGLRHNFKGSLLPPSTR